MRSECGFHDDRTGATRLEKRDQRYDFLKFEIAAISVLFLVKKMADFQISKNHIFGLKNDI